MLTELVLNLCILVHGISQNNFEILSVAEPHQTILAIDVRNQVLNKITKERPTIQNSLDCMMVHILDLFVSRLAPKPGQSITIKVFNAVSAANTLLVNRESDLLLKFVYLGKFIRCGKTKHIDRVCLDLFTCNVCILLWIMWMPKPQTRFMSTHMFSQNNKSMMHPWDYPAQTCFTCLWKSQKVSHFFGMYSFSYSL